MPEKEIQTFEEEFGIPSAKRLVQGEQPQPSTLGGALKSDFGGIIDRIKSRFELTPEQKDKYKKRGAIALAITLSTGVLAYPVAQVATNYAHSVQREADLDAESAKETQIIDNIYAATNAEAAPSTPIYQFVIGPDNPTASEGVEAFMSDPNSAFAQLSEQEQGKDARYILTSGKVLGDPHNSYWAVQPGDTIGVHDDLDLDMDGDNDMYLRIESRANN